MAAVEEKVGHAGQCETYGTRGTGLPGSRRDGAKVEARHRKGWEDMEDWICVSLMRCNRVKQMHMVLHRVYRGLGSYF